MNAAARKAPHVGWGLVESAVAVPWSRTVVRVPEGLDCTEALAELAGRHLGASSETHVFFGMRPPPRTEVTRGALKNSHHRRTILSVAWAMEKQVKQGVGRLLVSPLAFIPGRTFSLAVVDDPFHAPEEARNPRHVAHVENIFTASLIPHLSAGASAIVVVSGRHEVEGGDLPMRLKARGWTLLELE